MNSNRAVISLGSNLGNRMSNLHTAVQLIKTTVGDVTAISSVYETDAWGITDQNSFFNQVLICNTPCSPHELLKSLLSIEKQMGRVRKIKWGPRLIDLDVLFYNQVLINEPGLHIPHPQIQNRRFILEPLVEIDPNMIHPESNLTAEQLLLACEDDLGIKKLPHEHN